jgi:predicted ester cyclase
MSSIGRTMRTMSVVTAVLMATVIAGPVRGQADPAANKATVVAMLAGMSSPAGIDGLDDLFADDFVVHLPGGEAGWDAMKGAALAFATAIPDGRYTPLLMLAADDRVALRYELTGTFTGPLSGMEPNDGPISLTSNVILTLDDEGRITSYTESFDNLTLMTQMGAFPTPDPSASPTVEPVDPATWTITQTAPEFTTALEERLMAANQAAYGEGRVDALDDAYGADYVTHPTGTDLAQSKAEIAALHAAVPDLVITMGSSVAEGNWVAYQWTANGTFTKPLETIGTQLQPTGQPVSYGGITFAVANDDGLVTADWNEVDNLTIGTQFGMFPSASE